MLPFSIDLNNSMKEEKKLPGADKKNLMTKISQQALANSLVAGTMPQQTAAQLPPGIPAKD